MDLQVPSNNCKNMFRLSTIQKNGTTPQAIGTLEINENRVHLEISATKSLKNEAFVKLYRFFKFHRESATECDSPQHG